MALLKLYQLVLVVNNFHISGTLNDTQFNIDAHIYVSCVCLYCLICSFLCQENINISTPCTCLVLDFKVTSGYCFRFLLSMPLEERFKTLLCEVCCYFS